MAYFSDQLLSIFAWGYSVSVGEDTGHHPSSILQHPPEFLLKVSFRKCAVEYIYLFHNDVGHDNTTGYIWSDAFA
jgi:hypothetical protein